MNTVTLRWNGRAPQAPPIPDSVWENHRALICQLRPTMTLSGLIEAMASQHDFRASRKQYKLRFQKWGLPNLEAFGTLQDGSSRPDLSVSHDEHLIGTSGNAAAREKVPVLGEPPLEKLLGASNSEQDIYIRNDRSGIWSTCHQAAPEPSPSLNSGLERKEDMNSKQLPSPHSDTLATEVLPVMKTIAGSDPAIMTGTQHQVLLSMEDQAPRARRSMTRHFSALLLIRSTTMLGEALVHIPFEVAEAIEAADVSLAVGSYRDAYRIYNGNLQIVWASYAALPLTVHIITNMSRAASGREELLHCQSMVQQLLFEHSGWASDGKIHDGQAILPLYTSLALLLFRLERPLDAVKQCDFVLWIIKYLFDVAPRDFRTSENLLHTCTIYFSLSPYQLWNPDFWSQDQQIQHKTLQASFHHDEALRLVFVWCASSLVTGEISLSFADGLGRVYQDLADGAQTAAGQNVDFGSTTRALSVYLFRHFWSILSGGGRSIFWQTDVVQRVKEICKKMQISSPDLFAAIALALMNLLPPLRALCTRIDGCFETPDPAAENAIQLFRKTREAALELASTPSSEIVLSFLTAHSIIYLPSLTRPADSLTPIVEEVLPVPICPTHQEAERPEKMLLQTGSDDPTLSITPRSSFSSGFRSLKSLRRRINRRWKGDGTEKESRSEMISTQSSDSWSLRHHLGLSDVSYSNSYSMSSSRGAKSTRGSVMDSEPYFNGLGPAQVYPRGSVMDSEPAFSGIRAGVTA